MRGPAPGAVLSGQAPSGWEVVRLGAVANFRTGPFGSALHKSDYVVDGVPIINPMHIIDGKLAPTPSMTVTESAAKRLGEFRLRPGEVVIGRRGDMGRCAVVDDKHAGWLCGTGSMIVRPGPRMDPGFLQLVLSSPVVIAAIEAASVGSTMVNLNQGTLAGLAIQAPPRDEQAAISTAIADADSSLAKLDQLIAKKRDLKQATMQQLLSGEIRLSGYFDQCPTVQLVDLGAWVGGATPSMKNPTYWSDGDVPWISSGDVTQPLSISSLRLITRRAVMETATKVLPAGSLVLVTRSGILRHTLPIALVPSPVSINQDIKGLIPKPGVYGPFVLQALLESAPRILGTCLKAGTTVESIEFRWLKRFRIRLPEESEQRAIAEVLSDMDTELAALEARRDKTRLLKQGMMQALLTGRIRLT